MTYAPQTYKDARAFLLHELDTHPGVTVNDDLDPLEVGIVGDEAHIRAGTSYHLGLVHLKPNAYSLRLPRDRAGATNGAAALDIGWFSKTLPNGRTINLRTLSTWLVQQCQAGASDTLWIREIGYSPDGNVVLHWDRERGRTSAPVAGVFDLSHRWHTHISGYRDCETVDKTSLFRRALKELSEGLWTPTPPKPSAWVPTLHQGLPTLKRRDSGTFVRSAQAALYAHGFPPFPNDPRRSIDGDFGPKTEAAVRNFQAARGLKVDGIIGTGETWPALFSAAGTVARGNRGTAVSIAQALLCARGQWILIDGIAGRQTDEAIRSFQRARGLKVDGIAGPATWPRLIRG
jgi:hypothetical protein